MTTIREMATMSSKGQVTLPKDIRNALGIDPGSRLAVTLSDNKIVISVKDEHSDPAIASFFEYAGTGHRARSPYLNSSGRSCQKLGHGP